MTTSERDLMGYMVRPGEGREIPVPFGRAQVTMKAESGRTGGRITLYESDQEPQSRGPARHYHTHLMELFYVPDGEMTFLIGEELHKATAGATIVIPPGTVHTFHNTADTPARLLIMVLPGGFEGFFDEAKDLTSPMEGAAQWQRINERWDIHVVGPPLTSEIDDGGSNHSVR